MSKPVRILDLRDSPWVDGPGRTILDTACMVDQVRCEIIIGAFSGANHGEHAYMQQARERSLEVVPIKETGAFELKVLRQILSTIEQYSVDVIHTHDFRSDVYGLLCAKLSKKPVVATCHGWIANNAKGKVYVNIDKALLRLFDRVITVSEVMKSQLLKSGLKDRSIEVVRNALIIDDYNPDRVRQDFRNEMGLDQAVRIIANIGRLSPEKGQDIFLQSASDVLKQNKDSCFVLIGKGAEEQRLYKRARELGISDYVRFIGYRSDMVNIYNSVDLVVQSSFTEGMPNVILEALLMEVPVLATRVGGTGEIVIDGTTGSLIEPGSRSQLTNGIVGFLSDPEKYRAMAINGRRYVAGNFNHMERVERLMEIYEDMVKGRES